jgi:hypothetical protein
VVASVNHCRRTNVLVTAAAVATAGYRVGGLCRPNSEGQMDNDLDRGVESNDSSKMRALRKGLPETTEEVFVRIIGRETFETIMASEDRVRECLWSADPNLCCLALALLARLKTRDEVIGDRIFDLARKDPNDSVRQMAVLALLTADPASDAGKQQRKLLVEICLHEGEVDIVRKAAYFSLLLSDEVKAAYVSARPNHTRAGRQIGG